MLSSEAVDHIDDAGKGVFVQLFEWSWDDVAVECEQYFGPNRFAAVQVSPVQEHVQGVFLPSACAPHCVCTQQCKLAA